MSHNHREYKHSSLLVLANVHFNPRFIYGTYQQLCVIHRWPDLRKHRCICSLSQYLPRHLPLATTLQFWERCWRGAGSYLLFTKAEVEHLAVYFSQALFRARLWAWWLHWCSCTCVLHCCIHFFLHLLFITVDMPMDAVQVFADGDFLSFLPFFTCSSLMTMQW